MFKYELFVFNNFILSQALLDIQEFYELTLMDESKSNHTKTSEALQMASRWEVAGPPGTILKL